MAFSLNDYGDARAHDVRRRDGHAVPGGRRHKRQKLRLRAELFQRAIEKADEDRPLRLLKAFAVHALAQKLAGAANGFGLLAGALLRRLLIAAAQLHLAENTFALHLFLQCAKRLIDIIVANQNVDDGSYSR